MLESFVVRFVPSFCRLQRSFYKTNKQLGATVSHPLEVALRLLLRQIQKHPGSRVLQNNSLSFSKVFRASCVGLKLWGTASFWRLWP